MSAAHTFEIAGFNIPLLQCLFRAEVSLANNMVTPMVTISGAMAQWS